MAQSIFGTDYAVTALNRAFNNASPSNAVFQSQKATAGTTEQQNMAFAETFGAQFANVSDAALAKQVLTNLGVLPSTNEDVLALETELAAYFGVVSKGMGADARGIVVLQLANILSGLENATGDQAVYASAAKAWNTEVTKSFQYSANPASTNPYNGDFPADNGGTNPGNPGQSLTLTGGTETADVNGSAINGGAYVTTGFKFTSGNETVTGTSTTFTGTDTLIDGSNTDSDSLALTVVGTDTAVNAMNGVVTNIENISLAVNGAYVNGGIAGTTDVFSLANVTGAKSFSVSGSPAAAATLILGTPADLGASGINTIDSSKAGANLTFTAQYAATKTTNVTMIGGASADVFTGGSGNDTISGGAGNDNINGGAGNDIIRGGAGNDLLAGGAGRDTFVFESNAVLNGSDTFTDLAVGVNADILNFANFLSGGSVNQNGGATTTIVSFTAASNQNVNITNKLVTFDVAGAGNNSAAAIVAEFAANNAFSLDANGKAIVIVGNAGGANIAGIYMIDNSLDSSSTVSAIDVALVGTTNTINLSGLDVSNFVFA